MTRKAKPFDRELFFRALADATPSDEDAAKVLTDVRDWLAADRLMQHDRKRLDNICCAPELPVQLQGSPKPVPIQIS